MGFTETKSLHIPLRVLSVVPVCFYATCRPCLFLFIHFSQHDGQQHAAIPCSLRPGRCPAAHAAPGRRAAVRHGADRDAPYHVSIVGAMESSRTLQSINLTPLYVSNSTVPFARSPDCILYGRRTLGSAIPYPSLPRPTRRSYWCNVYSPCLPQNNPCLVRCIPNSVAPSPHSPTPGKICRSQCCDATSPWEKDYVSECKSHGGAVLFKDIDLLWNNASYACKNLFGKPTPCGENKRSGEGREREERAHH